MFPINGLHLDLPHARHIIYEGHCMYLLFMPLLNHFMVWCGVFDQSGLTQHVVIKGGGAEYTAQPQSAGHGGWQGGFQKGGA